MSEHQHDWQKGDDGFGGSLWSCAGCRTHVHDDPEDAAYAAKWAAGVGARPTAEDAARLIEASDAGEIPRRSTSTLAALLRDLPTARTDEAQRQAWLERKRALVEELAACAHDETAPT